MNERVKLGDGFKITNGGMLAAIVFVVGAIATAIFFPEVILALLPG